MVTARAFKPPALVEVRLSLASYARLTVKEARQLAADILQAADEIDPPPAYHIWGSGSSAGQVTTVATRVGAHNAYVIAGRIFVPASYVPTRPYAAGWSNWVQQIANTAKTYGLVTE